MVVRKDNKVYIKKHDLSGINYVVKYLDDNGDVENVKKFGHDFKWPFRRHRLEGGPLDGETVYLKRDQYWYDVESEDGYKLHCYSSRSFENEKDPIFTFDHTIEYDKKR